MTLREVLDAAGRAHVIGVLVHTDGNRGETARLLGLSRKNLWEKLRRYKITADSFPRDAAHERVIASFERGAILGARSVAARARRGAG